MFNGFGSRADGWADVRWNAFHSFHFPHHSVIIARWSTNDRNWIYGYRSARIRQLIDGNEQLPCDAITLKPSNSSKLHESIVIDDWPVSNVATLPDSSTEFLCFSQNDWHCYEIIRLMTARNTTIQCFCARRKGIYLSSRKPTPPIRCHTKKASPFEWRHSSIEKL